MIEICLILIESDEGGVCIVQVASLMHWGVAVGFLQSVETLWCASQQLLSTLQALQQQVTVLCWPINTSLSSLQCKACHVL